MKRRLRCPYWVPATRLIDHPFAAQFEAVRDIKPEQLERYLVNLAAFSLMDLAQERRNGCQDARVAHEITLALDFLRHQLTTEEPSHA